MSSKTVNIWVKVKGDAEKKLGAVTTQLKKSEQQAKKTTQEWRGLGGTYAKAGAEVEELSGKLKKNEQQAKKSGQQAKKNAVSWGKLASAVGGMVVLTKASAWMKESARLAMEQEKATTRLVSIAKGVTGATDDQIASLINLSKATQNQTTFADDAILAGQSQLLSYAVTAEQAELLTGSLADAMAATYGISASQGDAINTANMLAKALNGNSGELIRSGIVLTDYQRELVNTGTQTEKVAALVDIVADNFGGLAEAMALTDAGQLEQMENSIGDLREEVGAELLPAMISVKQATLDFYTVILSNKGAVISAVTELSTLVTATVEGLDFMLNGENRARAVDQNLEYLKNIKTEIESLDKQIGIASDNYESYFSAEGSTDEKILAGLDAEVEALIKKQQLARSLLSDLNESNAGRKTSAEVIDSTTATSKPDIAKKDTEAEKKAEELAAKVLKAKQAEWRKLIEGDIAYRETLVKGREQHADDIAKANEEAEAAAQTELERQQEIAELSIGIAQQAANDINNIINAVQNRKQQDYDNDIARQKEDVKNSSKSAKQKAAALAKIDEEAHKERHKLRMSEWRQSLIMSIVNTGLAITKTAATMGFPAAIPFIVAAGVTGGISTGIIAANKPKMYNGGKMQSQTGMTGDTMDVTLRDKEHVVPDDDFKAMNNKSNQTITIGGPVITIAGNADGGAVEQIKEVLADHYKTIEDMFTSGDINPHIINKALAV